MLDAGRDVSEELAVALQRQPREERILFVVDNVPEPSEGRSPEPLSKWCPGLAFVSLIVTSRARRIDKTLTNMTIDVLPPAPAVDLLCDRIEEVGVERSALSAEDWRTIAAWAGHLPLLLELLNAALRTGALDVNQLLHYARGEESPTRVGDAQLEALRGSVAEDQLRGVTEALAVSYEALTESQREVARRLAWLSPGDLPAALIDAACPSAGDRAAILNRSLLQQGPSIAGRSSWHMHRVLADFLRSRGSPENDWLAAAGLLRDLLPKEKAGDPTLRPLLISLVPIAALVGDRSLASGSVDPDEAGRLLFDLADVLYDLGTASGELEPSRASIALYETSLRFRTGERVPDHWAMTQNNLGNVLRILGQRRRDQELIQRAEALRREVATRSS
jgi:hypothetical protein